MALSSDNALMVLQLLAVCGRISRTGLIDIMPYSYRNKCIVIKKLVDEGYIRQSGQKNNGASYTLLGKGRTELTRLNPERYLPELFQLHDLLKRHPERSKLRGDVAAAMSLAGYAVHPADKPALPAVTPVPKEISAEALKALYRNGRPQDYTEARKDNGKYIRRITPIGCYYDSLQIKYTREVGEDRGTNYARATGILFTPSHLFRVYHGNQSNIQFNKTGEDNFHALLRETFQGYAPPEKKAVLLFGRGYAPAISLLNTHLNGRWSGKGQNPLVSPTNLGVPLYYLALAEQSLELLRLMRYPDWHKSITIFVSEVLFGIKRSQAWSYQHDSHQVYILADLNLTHFASALRQIQNHPLRPARFVCMPWQREFIETQVNRYSNDNPNMEICCLPDDFLSKTTRHILSDYWEDGSQY